VDKQLLENSSVDRERLETKTLSLNLSGLMQMYSAVVSNPSRIKLQRRRPPNSIEKPWTAVMQTDRCAEGKQLKRKPTLDLLITKSKPQFPLRGKF